MQKIAKITKNKANKKDILVRISSLEYIKSLLQLKKHQNWCFFLEQKDHIKSWLLLLSLLFYRQFYMDHRLKQVGDLLTNLSNHFQQ